MNVHSSQLPRFAPIPKTVNGRTKSDERAARLAAEEKQLREAYAAVDRRDGGRCRICFRRVSPKAINGAERAEHHHLVKRSQGGTHTTDNILTLCVSRCHDDIHVRALLKLSGDADLKDVAGTFCGVKVERYTDGSDWQVVAWR